MLPVLDFRLDLVFDELKCTSVWWMRIQIIMHNIKNIMYITFWK